MSTVELPLYEQSAKSPAQLLCDTLAELGEAEARAVIDRAWEQMSVTEAAALRYDWREFWARPKQLIPPLSRGWRSFGFCTGRGYGKTVGCSYRVNEEAEGNPDQHYALMAQNEDKADEILVSGPSGLIATSPPWFKAESYKNGVVWPNGTHATIYTPHEPENLRGPEHHGAWITELIAWPASTRAEAMSNLMLGLRKGYAWLLWDTTPKRRNPMIRERFEEHQADPLKHIIRFGHSAENASNVNRDNLRSLMKKLGGTQKGDEELGGIFTDDDESALWRYAWIDNTRRPVPERLKRRIIIVDPAISQNRGSDHTGMCEEGLGVDDQVHVIADHSGSFAWEDWGRLAVRLYMKGRCDCILVERNRGGDACAANIKAAAREFNLRVQIVKLEAPTRAVPGIIYVKEVNSRGKKGERAEPVAAQHKAGYISHALEPDTSVNKKATLAALEERLCTWVPEESAESPNELDAMVMGVWELLGWYLKGAPDEETDMQALASMAEDIKRLAAAPALTREAMRAGQSSGNVMSVLGRLLGRGAGGGWGRGL